MKRRKFRLFDKDMNSILKLYFQAFPEDERMPVWMMKAMTLRKGIDFDLYYLGGRLCAMTYCAVGEGICYVFYLAVESSLRDRGIGSFLLGQLRRDYPSHTVIVEIERPDSSAENNAERLRRKGFYLRNGFAESGREVSYGGVDYQVLSSKELDEQALERLIARMTFGLWHKGRAKPLKEDPQ